MKKIIILAFACILLVSCEKKPKEITEWEWHSMPWDLMPPVCAVWYKPGPLGWLPYKCFAQADELRTIINLLWESDSQKQDPYFYTNPEYYKLSFIFYKGNPKEITVSELYFRLEHSDFVWSRGKNRKLAEIFVSQKPWGQYYESPNDPNMIKRAQEAQERLYKEAQRLKAEKERENATIEPNIMAR